MSNCVNVPSPDHDDVSSSNGMMNGHQPAEHPVAADRAEAGGLEQPPNGGSARILADGRGDVPVGVGIAMKRPSERAADGGEIRQVSGTDDGVLGTVEIEREKESAGREHAANLVDRDVEARHV